MKKIFLFCDAGMSTSILVNKMMEIVKKHSLDIYIEAFPFAKLHAKLEDEKPDCVLLGPQVKFLLKSVQGECEEKNIPIEVINSMDYGAMNGEKVLKHAIKMIKQNTVK